jgi:hypothetical protein
MLMNNGRISGLAHSKRLSIFLKQWHKFRNRSALQLREQLPILMGFPFNSLMLYRKIRKQTNPFPGKYKSLLSTKINALNLLTIFI